MQPALTNTLAVKKCREVAVAYIAIACVGLLGLICFYLFCNSKQVNNLVRLNKIADTGTHVGH